MSLEREIISEHVSRDKLASNASRNCTFVMFISRVKSEHLDKNEWAAVTDIRSEYSCRSNNINEGWLSFDTQTINVDFFYAPQYFMESPHMILIIPL